MLWYLVMDDRQQWQLKVSLHMHVFMKIWCAFIWFSSCVLLWETGIKSNHFFACCSTIFFTFITSSVMTSILHLLYKNFFLISVPSNFLALFLFCFFVFIFLSSNIFNAFSIYKNKTIGKNWNQITNKKQWFFLHLWMNNN